MTHLVLNNQGIYRGTFSEVSNRADWLCDIEVINDATEEPIDISTATITAEVQNGLVQTLLATTGNGKVTFPGSGIDGIFRFTFSASELSALSEGNYNVGVVMVLDSQIHQLIIAMVPIVEGHIS